MDKVVLFTPGRANNYIVKNYELAQEVMNCVSEVFPSVRLELIVNKAPEEVAMLMNAADCLLLTSLHEGSPNVVKEAMACNLPVVTVAAGDVVERLEFVQPSIVVNSRAASDLARTVIQILNDPTRSNGVLEINRQGLSREAVAEKILEIYNRVNGTK